MAQSKAAAVPPAGASKAASVARTGGTGSGAKASMPWYVPAEVVGRRYGGDKLDGHGCATGKFVKRWLAWTHAGQLDLAGVDTAFNVVDHWPVDCAQYHTYEVEFVDAEQVDVAPLTALLRLYSYRMYPKGYFGAKRERAAIEAVHTSKRIDVDAKASVLRPLAWGATPLLPYRTSMAPGAQMVYRMRHAVRLLTEPRPLMLHGDAYVSLPHVLAARPTAALSVRHAALIGVGCARALHTVHTAGYVHCGVRPAAFALRCKMGAVERPLHEQILLIDLTTARRYLSDDGQFREDYVSSSVRHFQGAPLYASMAAHEYRPLFTNDDFISLLYMLAEWLLPDGLPWSLDKSLGRIKAKKAAFAKSPEYAGLPASVAKSFGEHVRPAGAPAHPSYQEMIEALLSAAGGSKEEPSELWLHMADAEADAAAAAATTDAESAHLPTKADA